MINVLIVDDDIQVMNAAKDYLEVKGYNVMLIGDALEALNFIRNDSNTIDVIVLDNIMPISEESERIFGDISTGDVGKVILKEIKKIRKHAKVIVRTVVKDDNLIKEIKAIGVDGYLLKTKTGPEDLEQSIARCL